MVLATELVSQFVKATKDTEKKKTETTVYGTTKVQNGITYVQIDGSDVLTPVVATADTKDGERVTVMIKNHTALITGNVSSPAARTEDVQNIAGVTVDYEIIKKSLDALVPDVENCKNDIENLQATEMTLTSSLAEQKRSISAINLKLTNIENDMLDYNKTMAELESDVLSVQLTLNNQAKSIKSINDELIKQNNDIETLQTTIDNQAKDIQTINKRLEEIISRLDELTN